MIPENSHSVWIVERGDCPADFAACPAKESGRRLPSVRPGRIELIGLGEGHPLVLRILGYGEAQKQQQPLIWIARQS
jgi:hypothetical protein